MRIACVSLLLVGALVPFSGCIGGGPAAIDLGLFGLEAITRGDPSPVAVADCAELLDVLNGRAEREATVALYQSVENVYWHGPWLMDDVAMAETATSAPQAADGAHRAADAEVTGTNNQEAGVDEADILKTDGEWTYVLHGSELIILHTEAVGDLEEVARVEVEVGWGGQLLLEDRGTADPSDDRLIVIGVGGQPQLVQGSRLSGIAADRLGWGMTHIVTLGLADRAHPTILDDRWIEGQPAGARLVGGTAYIVVHAWNHDLQLRTWAWPDEPELDARGLTWESFYNLSEEEQRDIRLDVAMAATDANRAALSAATLADHLPVLLTTLAPGTALARALPESISESACRRVLATDAGTGRSTSTILSVGIAQQHLPTRVTQILGGAPIVYGAEDAIVLAAPSTETWWYWAQPELTEATDLHWFDLDGLDVTHRASGRVDGIVQDQFGIDVHDGQLRIATTTGTWGRWWMETPAPMMNHLAIFEEQGGELVEMGRVGDIAPGERIWSARFTDDRAYIVTFVQIDPLWIIDLSDPRAPRILGELEVPGVSTYIHPVSDDLLLTIGLGPGPGGIGLDWSRVQVSLFDISDLARPVRADVLDLSPGVGGWSFSAAVDEHKAFTYWPAIGKLAVPLSTSREYQVATPEGPMWRYAQHVSLQLIDVDTATMTLSRYGEVDQDALAAAASVDDPYGGYGTEIQRSYFLGFPQTGPVSVYAMSSLGMTAHDLATLEEQSSVFFGGQPGYYWID
jgi:hypothetical protein